MTVSRIIPLVFACVVGTTPASALPLAGAVCRDAFDLHVMAVVPMDRPERVWRVDFGASRPAVSHAPAAPVVNAAGPADDEEQATRPRPKAFEYSHAYEVRRKIHVIGSYAMVPLFVTQLVLGQRLYDFKGGDSSRTAHIIVGSSIGALFAMNTVTGVWNLWEARKDPNHRTRRRLHGLLMLGADAGFLATGLLAPDRDDPNYLDQFSTHRAVAITSIAAATTGYLVMLLSR